MASKNYCVSKLLKLTKEQAKLLSEKSKEQGISESAYIRQLIGQ